MSGITPPTEPLVIPGSGLRIYLLGPPRVEWDGQSWAIPRRQARALLFRLAAVPQAVSREHLRFLFWPDTPEADARRHFTRLLTHLRRALPVADLLTAHDDCIGLDPARTWSDSAEFAQLCAGSAPGLARLAPGARDDPPHAELLRRGAALYRGAFLAGFSIQESPEFENWSRGECAALERRYLEALEALIEECAARGAYSDAIAYARRYLAIDELAEQIHCRLMGLYAQFGERSAALRQYESCAAILERELGVSPLPETQATYQAILGGQPAIELLVPLSWSTLPTLDAPLIGRADALNTLTLGYARACSGRGTTILISGEPGIGKSRLLQEFVTGLRETASVLVGAGHETERGLPYGVLIQALRPHAAALHRTVPDVEIRYLAELACLLPELRPHHADLPPLAPAESGLEQGRLFQALVHLCEGLATRHQPLVLCLDDLHWADEVTLKWLSYLAWRMQSTPLLLLGAYRAEEGQAVAALRAELARSGTLQEIVLEGLSHGDVLRLIRHLSGQPIGAENFSLRLHRETDGNPFFLLETLRAMFEAGTLWQDETGWNTNLDAVTEDYRELPLPTSVSQAIRDHLRRLSAPARQVLEAVAVVGAQFSFDLALAVSGRREDEVTNAVDELLSRQVIFARGSVYRFHHDLIRTVVYHDLSYGRRRLLHRRAAHAVECIRPDDIAMLAWHFEQAEEYGRAARYALWVGQRAKSVFAHAEARTSFDKAIALLEEEAETLRKPKELTVNRSLLIEALHERGWALRLLGDMTTYTRDSAELARLSAQLGDQRALAQSCWRKAHAHRWFCRDREALVAAEEGVRLSLAAGDALCEAICQRELGLAARALGDYVRAQATLERALDLFVALGDTEYESHVLGNLSTLYLIQGDPGRALALARRALARCEEVNLPFNRRLALGDMGAAALASGDTGAARRWLDESLIIGRQIADRTQEILCLGHLGWLAIQEGRAPEAAERLNAALVLAEGIDSRAEQSWLQAGLAEAYRLIGDLAQALMYAQCAHALGAVSGRVCDQALAKRVLARVEQMFR